MKPFKGVEGLTKGHSLCPLTRMIWINNCPQLDEIDRRIRLMAGLILDNTTSRHLKKTVIDRENRWVDKTVEFFEARCVLNRDTVSQFPKIVNIGSGYVAPNTVNIHEAHQVGNKILSIMDGVVVEGKFKWNRKECVTQMPSKPRIMVIPDGKKSEYLTLHLHYKGSGSTPSLSPKHFSTNQVTIKLPSSVTVK